MVPGESCLQMLQEYVVPGLQVYASNFGGLCFMQHGAPAHFANTVHSSFSETSPTRITGRTGSMEYS